MLKCQLFAKWLTQRDGGRWYCYGCRMRGQDVLTKDESPSAILKSTWEIVSLSERERERETIEVG